MRRLISATGAGLAAAALAILFGFAGPAHAQGSGPGSGPTNGGSDTTATTAFAGDAVSDDGLANTGVETWVLVSGAGAALASAAGARRLLRSRI